MRRTVAALVGAVVLGAAIRRLTRQRVTTVPLPENHDWS